MYFIEHFCDMAQRENHPNYVRMMQQDILTIVDAVAPSDGSGAANVKVVRRVCSYNIRETNRAGAERLGIGFSGTATEEHPCT